MAVFSNASKNTTTYTNVDKITGTGLWSSGTLPWQLPLPWQFKG